MLTGSSADLQIYTHVRGGGGQRHAPHGYLFYTLNCRDFKVF